MNYYEPGVLLARAMGYPTTFPKAPVTRSIRILFADRVYVEPSPSKKKYIPVKYRPAPPKKDELNFGQKEIMKMINKGLLVTGDSAAKKTCWTRNHCSMILTSLYKKGLVKRYKESGNGTRWYVYKKLEGK